jgi:membrane fusion protein, heavy metal efflux system
MSRETMSLRGAVRCRSKGVRALAARWRARVTAVLISAAIGVACRGGPGAQRAEAPSLNVTDWTDETELYMEYPPLVTGQSALFAVHLTNLADFRPLMAGRPRIDFTPESGGPATTLPGREPSRPGAFRVEGVPPAPGRYRWALVIDAAGLSDRHELGIVTVFADAQAAIADAEKRPPDDPAAFAYLKEQQWTNEFATARVREADLRTAVRVPADIEPLTGGEAVVSAPAAGRFAADALMAVGANVRVGQALGRLEPRLSNGDDRASLTAAVAEARIAHDAARAEQIRAERLLADRAVPARRVEDAHRAVGVADARLRAAEARLAQREETLRRGGGSASGNAFVLHAPLSGRLAQVMATLGASYDEGAALFKIVRTDRVELRAQVPVADAAGVRDVAALAFEVPGRAEPIALVPHHAHDAGVIDAATRALPVQFEVENQDGRLLIGQTGTAVLYKRDRLHVPAVPQAAVLLEAGRSYVFIQIAGERFVRRYVEIAARDGDLVGVKRGLTPGERVVVRGAYDVQLASAARGLPAEGHVH